MGLDRPIDITAEQRKTVLALLGRHLPNTTAWVYGSRAKWTARLQSDLDLVVFATPEQERRVSDLREAFEESDLPFRVDLFIWDAVPEKFRKQIEAEHVVLVEREEQVVGNGWRETVYGRFSADFVEDCLANLCDPINGVQTGPFGSQLHKKDYVSSGTPIITVVISKAVVSDEVVDIFAAAGLKKPDISILSDEFLAEVRDMPQRNLAVELLQKLLKGEVKARSKRNVVQGRSFADLLEQGYYFSAGFQPVQIIRPSSGRCSAKL